jgi:Fic family protein
MPPDSDNAPRGDEVTTTWGGRPLQAYLPRPLAAQTFDLGPKGIRDSERAIRVIEASAKRPERFESLAMLLLRAEGVASSNVEGIHAPIADLAAAEMGGTDDPTALSVAKNLAAVIDALASASSTLSEDLIRTWHRRLMEGDPLLDPRMVGAYRTEQSWIGGTSPRNAAFVPPPAEYVGALMADLVEFANTTTLDPVTQAAVFHAQFETIHPFGDGNGRIGRILIGWILAHRLEIAVPPPVSVSVVLDPGGYLAGMTLFRMGQLDPWVEWLSQALWRSCEIADEAITRSEATIDGWRQQLLGLRSDATALRVLDVLVQHPVLSASMVAEALDVSDRSGRRALDVLASHGIIEWYTPDRRRPGRPQHLWMATELLAAFAGH